MELHSYAKRRTSKKWTIEQKRKLVESRIAHDAWFTSKPSSLVPWKNILIAANLDDFNVFFVRKQWSNMLARYKQYKQTRFGNNIGSKAIDAELIKRINQEWEFFEPIHKFMTRKTTNLHSYALTHRSNDINSEQQEKRAEVQNSAISEQERRRETNPTPTKLLHNATITISKPKDCVKENIPNNTTTVIQSANISQDDGIHLFSSDTNEEFQIIAETTRTINSSKGRQLAVADDEDDHMNCARNTDHDFYSKRSSLGETVSQLNCLEEDELQEQQSNYFADASEESQGSLNMIVDLLQVSNSTNTAPSLNTADENFNKTQTIEVKTENLSYSECFAMKKDAHDQEFVNDMPSTSTENNLTLNIANPKPSSKPVLSERDKYYRHKRRFNARLEKRFDAILHVMGEVVKAAYPKVDINPLVATVTSMASSMGKVLSSDSEDDNESDENNTNIPKASHET